MTDIEFDRAYDICSKIAEANGIEETRWSIYEMVFDEDSFNQVIHKDGVRIIYRHYWSRSPIDPDFVGHESPTLSVAQEGPVTMLDMWKLADQIIRESGDLHHIFIEAFKAQPDGSVELWTGS